MEGKNLSKKQIITKGRAGKRQKFLMNSEVIIYYRDYVSTSTSPSVKVVSSMPFDFLYHVNRENDLKTELLGANLFLKRREREKIVFKRNGIRVDVVPVFIMFWVG